MNRFFNMRLYENQQILTAQALFFLGSLVALEDYLKLSYWAECRRNSCGHAGDVSAV